MMIDMKDGKKEEFPNFKGGNGVLHGTMFFDGTNRCLYGTLDQGSSIGLHTHEGNCEFIYIFSGKAKFIMDDSIEYGVPGQIHYCPEGHTHSMINEDPEPLVFLGVIPKQP